MNHEFQGNCLKLGVRDILSNYLLFKTRDWKKLIMKVIKTRDQEKGKTGELGNGRRGG